MGKRTLALAAFAAALSSTAVGANPARSVNPAYAVACSGCSAGQAQAAAEEIALFAKPDARATALGYGGFVYVYDFNASSVSQYGVSLKANDGTLVTAYVGAAPEEIRRSFATQRSAIVANHQSATLFFQDAAANLRDFPAAGVSGIDVVATGAYRNLISEWLLGGASSSNAAALTHAALALVLTDRPLTIVDTVTLADGSRIVLQYRAGERRFALVEAYDSEQNAIPGIPAREGS